MPENDLEMFGGAPAAKEAGEQSDEKFQEEMRQTQAAVTQLRQEEQRAKSNDDKIAQIIVQFLSQAGNTDLFLLISRCVAQNIPSEVLLTILSLVDRTAFMEMQAILKEAQSQALTIPVHGSIHDLSEGQMQAINEWLNHIALAGLTKPHQTLEAMLIKKTNPQSREVIQEISVPLIQLSAFIMRNFLAMQNTEIEYERLYEFMESVYLKIIQNLEETILGQKKLTE